MRIFKVAVILDLALSPSHTNLLLSHGYYCKIFTSEILNHVTQVAKNGMYAKEINFTFLKAVERIFLVHLSCSLSTTFLAISILGKGGGSELDLPTLRILHSALTFPQTTKSYKFPVFKAD